MRLIASCVALVTLVGVSGSFLVCPVRLRNKRGLVIPALLAGTAPSRSTTVTAALILIGACSPPIALEVSRNELRKVYPLLEEVWQLSVPTSAKLHPLKFPVLKRQRLPQVSKRWPFKELKAPLEKSTRDVHPPLLL